MIVLLLGTHIFLTIRTKFIQYKTITKGIPLSVAKEEGADGEVSQFQALATALASTIGTGLANIKAVAEKYHGAMEVRTDGEKFTLSVLLIIPQQSESISQQVC